MKNRRKFLVLGCVLALLAIAAFPLVAQDETPPGGAGAGGIIIEGTISDPIPFNPLVCADTSCQEIATFLFPGLVAVDPTTATFVESGPGALATGWTISEDGLTYTFTLRDDYTWNDGTPITAADFAYSFNAIASGQLQNTLYGFITETVESMEATDATTLVVKMKQADCRAIASASVPALPSHVLPTDYAELNDLDWNINPDVTGGPFKFNEYKPSEQVSVVADQNYPDAEFGFVSPEGYIVKVVPDTTVMVEQFLAGETNFIDNPVVGRREDIRNGAEEGKYQVYSYAGDFYDYLAFNLADPKNPQSGLDEDGNAIPQGYHPIFGNKEVRQALAKAVDIDAMITAAVFGEGTRMTSYLTASSWAYNTELPPIAYDPEGARAILDQVGWVDDDGDEGADNTSPTPRVAQGVTLPDGSTVPDGTVLSFTMLGNEGNTRRAAEGQLIQDQLKQIGVDAQYQAVDFATWQDTVNAQTFDVVMLAWSLGYPDDPDVTQLFDPVSDVVGSGNNFTSYNNPEFTALNEQARTLPGCDTAERAEIYKQMQVIMQEDVPYLWMYSINGMYVAAANVQNFGPYPAQPRWNVDSWYVE
jgi:peptide/nickel transport system substrate-binding protein